MRELQLVLSDDLTYALDGIRVPADETVVIALDGKTRELDLTAKNAQDLRDLLAPYLKAGHIPGNQPGNQPGNHPGPSGGKPAGSTIVVSRARQQLIRDFADNLGLRSPDGKRPVYRTESGGYYYSHKLMKMYEAHQAEQAARGNA